MPEQLTKVSNACHQDGGVIPLRISLILIEVVLHAVTAALPWNLLHE